MFIQQLDQLPPCLRHFYCPLHNRVVVVVVVGILATTSTIVRAIIGRKARIRVYERFPRLKRRKQRSRYTSVRCKHWFTSWWQPVGEGGGLPRGFVGAEFGSWVQRRRLPRREKGVSASSLTRLRSSIAALSQFTPGAARRLDNLSRRRESSTPFLTSLSRARARGAAEFPRTGRLFLSSTKFIKDFTMFLRTGQKNPRADGTAALTGPGITCRVVIYHYLTS